MEVDVEWSGRSQPPPSGDNLHVVVDTDPTQEILEVARHHVDSRLDRPKPRIKLGGLTERLSHTHHLRLQALKAGFGC